MTDPAFCRERNAKQILSGTVCTIPEAARVIGVSPWAVYKALRADEAPFPVVRCGRRVIVPVAPLRRLLGLDERPG